MVEVTGVNRNTGIVTVSPDAKIPGVQLGFRALCSVCGRERAGDGRSLSVQRADSAVLGRHACPEEGRRVPAQSRHGGGCDQPPSARPRMSLFLPQLQPLRRPK